MKQLSGQKITCSFSKCFQNGGAVNEQVLNSYCWMYSSFNMPADYEGACTNRKGDSGSLFNSYYQWVSIYLVLSALVFYTPRAVWLCLEGGLMKFLAQGANEKIVENASEKRESLIKLFQAQMRNKYNVYAFWFLCCEQLNFLVVIVLCCFTEWFLDNQFMEYGIKVWQFYNIPHEERDMYNKPNPMCNAFPRVASCKYVRYGTGGDQEDRSAICILGLNMINDKVNLLFSSIKPINAKVK